MNGRPEAPAGASSSSSGGSRNTTTLLDISPLTTQVNAFWFGARFVERALPHVADKAVREDLGKKIEWLEWLAKSLDIESNEPLIMVALSRAALHQETRRGLIRTLHALDKLIDGDQAEPEPPAPSLRVVSRQLDPKADQRPPVPPPEPPREPVRPDGS